MAESGKNFNKGEINMAVLGVQYDCPNTANHTEFNDGKVCRDVDDVPFYLVDKCPECEKIHYIPLHGGEIRDRINCV